MNLADVKVGSAVRVKKVRNPLLVEMGFVRGAEVRVLRRAPLGDPIEFEVKGYKISLRRAEASLIEVEDR